MFWCPLVTGWLTADVSVHTICVEWATPSPLPTLPRRPFWLRRAIAESSRPNRLLLEMQASGQSGACRLAAIDQDAPGGRGLVHQHDLLAAAGAATRRAADHRHRPLPRLSPEFGSDNPIS